MQFARFLLGNDTVAINNILIDSLALRSRPENALIGGRVHLLGHAADRGGHAAALPVRDPRPGRLGGHPPRVDPVDGGGRLPAESEGRSRRRTC